MSLLDVEPCGVFNRDEPCGAEAVDRLVPLNSNMPDLPLCELHLAAYIAEQGLAPHARPPWFDWFTADEWRALAEHAVAEGERVDHPTDGRPCIVLGLMYSHFDDREAHHLLLEHTCFPMSDTDALPQALEIVREHDAAPQPG